MADSTQTKRNLGYDDTPVIPGSKWKVHDGNRPQPQIVNPGTLSTQDKPGVPPSDAYVLFDGRDASKWQGRDGEVKWEVKDGALCVVPGTGSIWTKDSFGDCQLHIEWAAPTVVKGEGQGRGNSGVFLLRKYEIQVLDCYDNLTYPDGTTAAIYGQYPPLVNACRKPGEWQTYDIVFVTPHWEGGKLVRPAYATVIHNGVVVHHCKEIQGPTQHRTLAKYDQHEEKGAIELQDHGDLVRFRNIWIRPMKDYDEDGFVV